MKNIIFAIVLFFTFSTAHAVTWTDTYTEDTDISGSEVLLLEKPSTEGVGNNWAKVSLLRDGTGTDDQTALEVPFTPFSSIAATNTQAAIEEIYNEATGGTDDQTAAEVLIDDGGSLYTATNVEAALQEAKTAIDLNTAKETDTDDQTLSFSSPNLSISGGNSVSLSALSTDQLTFHADGGGAAITTGIKTCYPVEYAATIQSVRAMCDQSGSISVDIWKDTAANYPPTDADSITASAPAAISSDDYSLDSTLTGWTTAITAGDILCYNVDSATTVEWCTVTLKVAK